MSDDHTGARPRIAYPGEPGAFSEEAAHSAFPEGEPLPCEGFAEVVAAVTSGMADYGILPVRNSLVGPIPAANAILRASGLHVLGELVRDIRPCLLGLPGARIEGIRRVISHPVALAQCRAYLASLGLAARPVHDTAGAARLVAENGDPAMAAIAGRAAAECYGLEILAADIADRPDNRTCFAIIARSPTAAARAARATR